MRSAAPRDPVPGPGRSAGAVRVRLGMASVDRVRERLQSSGVLTGRGGARGASRTGGGFQLGRLEPGLGLSAGSALLLLVLMLFDWFLGGSAWQLKWVDLLLFGLAALAIAAGVGRAVNREALPAEAAGLLLTVAGAVAVGAMLTLVLESSGGTVPLVLSLLAAGGILGGGLLTIRSPSERSDGGGAGPRSAATRPARRSPPHADDGPAGPPRPFDRDTPAA